jgi:hypothetical protein
MLKITEPDVGRRLVTLLATGAHTLASRQSAQPEEENIFTIFCETRHVGLADFTVAALAQAWQLADYLMLAPAYTGAIAEHLTQRMVVYVCRHISRILRAKEAVYRDADGSDARMNA